MAIGSSIQIASASFTNGLKVSLTCPDRTGLIGEYLLRENAARSIRNIANLSVPAALIGAGTPVYNLNSVLLSGSASYGNGIAGLDTRLLQPADVTLIVVRKKISAGVSTGAPPWFGSVVPSNRGLADYQEWNFYNNQSGVPPVAATLTKPADTGFHFQAGVGPNAGKGLLYVATEGVLSSNEGTVAGTAVVPGTATIKLCGSTGNYQMELAYAAVYDRVLTPAQIAAAYDTLKAYFATRNLVVS